jgi:hypothetical protein
MLVTFLQLSLLVGSLQLAGQESVVQDRLLSSPSGNYRYSVEYTTHGIGETPIRSFTLYNRDRQPLLTLNAPGEEMFFVADQGWFVGVLATGSSRHVRFYDRRGRIRGEYHPAEDANYAMSGTGRCFYVNTSDGLRTFDATGRIVARFGAGSWFRSSAGDELVAMVQRDAVTVYRGDGGKLAQFRLGSLLFRDLTFSPNREYLAVAERSVVSLYSLREPGLVWRTALDSTVSLLSLAVDCLGRVYAGGEGERLLRVARAGFLSVLENAEELARIPIAYADDHETINAVKADQGNVQVLTAYHRFRFQEENTNGRNR